MSDLRELYQEMILDHGRTPRNFKVLEGANREAEGFNPLCGDQVTLYLKYENDVVEDVSFQGKGCAISTASASMLTEAIQGKTRAEVDDLLATFHGMLTAEPGTPPDADKLGKLAVFSGVCEYPNRIKCASLVWHTLGSALDGDGGDDAVTTE